MNQRWQIELHDNGKCIGHIHRVPIQHIGWMSVRYKSKRYQVFGMIRTPARIELTNPIGGRK